MIKSKSELVSDINSELADNAVGDISPADIRHNLIDIIDSVHNLITTETEINTLHFGTPDTTSVRFGEQSLSKLDLSGYSTSGNTAIGYAALQNNYQAIRNTAIGSYALNCNVHGYDNVGAGYSSLAGNTTGFANIGVGAYTLNHQKTGDFNIAIGHGAGYYADKNTNNTLFIGSHNVDAAYICANPRGSGLTPLIYGDMSANILGVATRGLHPYGVLQTSGNITPSTNRAYTLGHSLYRWNLAHVHKVACSSIQFDNNTSSLYSESDGIIVSGNVLPFAHNNVDLGSNGRRFDNLYVRKITADSGIISTTTNYIDKTLFLASSGTGPFVGYLDESGVLGAGVEIRVSGIDDPSFIYDSTNNVCGSTFRRWKSNIGIEIASGEFLRSTSFIAPSSCMGLHYHSGQLFSSTRSVFDNDIFSIAGTGNINFVKDSGNSDTEYAVSYIAQESGIDISQRFLYRAAGRNLEDGKDRLSGFVLKAIDEYGSDISSNTNLDRFAISSFDNSSNPTNSVIIMKNNENGAVLGVNNFSNGDGTLATPKTIFNVRSNTNATARITSETSGDTQTKLQLMGECNDESDGLEFKFSRANHLGDINIYQESGIINFVRLEPSGAYNQNKHGVGILTDSGNVNAMLTIGNSGYSSAAISMYTNPSNAIATSGYGKLYVNDKVKTSTQGVNTQSHTLEFIDGTGNIFDLIYNQCDHTSYSTFYKYGNLSVGPDSIRLRCDLTGSTYGNVAFGPGALSGVNGGDYNTVLGFSSAKSITTGSKNVVVGFSNLGNSSGYISNNIIVGNNLGGGLQSSNTLLIGNAVPTISGDLVTRNVSIPYGDLIVERSNKLILKASDRADELRVSTDAMTIYDSGVEFPNQSYTFEFIGSGNTTHDLLILDHSVSGMTNTTSYESPAESRPFAELKGDLKLQGAVRFSDGYSLSGADMRAIENNLEYVSGVSLGNFATLSTIFVEGYALGDINVATSYNSPSSGSVINYNDSNTNYTVVNRDKHTKIKKNDFVIAIKINSEYRPIWVSNENSVCNCCIK